MALQDLTPELRTRLSRVEKWVGLFITLATFLLLFGLGYYLYQTAQRKGWFLEKVPYHTYVQDASGLSVGDQVKLMGFDVGQITEIEAMGPYEYFNVYLQFEIRQPYYGYLWTDSRVRIATKDLLGNRYLEVTKGSTGAATVLTIENEIDKIKGVLDHKIKTGTDHVPVTNLNYIDLTNGAKGFWLTTLETPALTERLEEVVNLVQAALPNVFALTNELRATLGNASNIAAHADQLLVAANPAVTNLALITQNLARPDGALGEWLFPTNLQRELEATLANAAGTLAVTRTNVDLLANDLHATLQNVANLTSNLNDQVQANSLILSEISSLIINADKTLQGLQRHWLLKGAFETDDPAAPESRVEPRLAPPK